MVWEGQALSRDGKAGKGSRHCAGDLDHLPQPLGRAHPLGPSSHSPSGGRAAGEGDMEVRVVPKPGHRTLVLFLTRPGSISGS